MTDNTNVKLSTFFGGKRIGTYDRLGTAKYDQQNGGAMSFYPYGEDRGTVQPNDSLKFATYTRDSATGLDYADQRYYANNFGRFMSPDPSSDSGGPSDPQSWNRYSYVGNDPVNFFDRFGLLRSKVEEGGDGSVEDDSVFDCLLTTPFFWDFKQSVAYCTGGGINFGQGQGNPGGGGIKGARGPSAGTAHSPGSSIGPAGYSAAIALLKAASADCLKDLDAASSNAATAALSGSQIIYTWGLVPTINADDQITNGSRSLTSVQATPTQPATIWINLNFGWYNPSDVNVNLASGGTGSVDWLATVGNSIGDPGLTLLQYYELSLLHELGHILGVPQESDSTYNKAILDDCINGH